MATTKCHSATVRRGRKARSRQAQKMEALGRLAGSIAHDFNNMLTIILGNAELLQAQLPRQDSLNASVREIDHAARRAADLVRRLLAFSRQQQQQSPQNVDLNEIVRDLVPLLERLLGDEVVLTTDLAPEPATILADRPQIEQVIVNLAINARDAMDCGGQLRIQTTTIEVDAAGRHRGFDGLTAASYRQFSIVDTGAGMDESTLAHIFEPYFTTKGPQGGSGLGLPTVDGIVTENGGRIAVISRPGHGTRFDLLFSARVEPCRPEHEEVAAV